VMMDEIFGEDNFVNEIVWKRTSARSDSQTYNHIHDVLYFYGKTETFAWNAQHTQHDEAYQAERYSFTDVDGRKYQLTDMTSPNPRPNMMYVWKGFEPPINGWRFSRETMEKLDAQERVWYPEDKTKRPRLKRYLDESKGRPLDSVWTDIYPVNSQAAERLDYSTQKPEALLERIIKASSNEGMVVADFFGGSGVTAKVAHALGRRFIHADVGVNSLQTARDRLKAAGAAFTLCDIQDGVSLFRNPVQTMDKLKSLITGLKNEDSLDKFWEGALQDAKLGLVPVYLPNLLDHTTKILDIPLMNRILREALPDLPDGVKQVIVFYVDIDDPATLDKFIKDENPTDIKIELRDLKVVLDEVVLNDVANYEVRENGAYEIEITGFVSDRLQQKIDEYNAKKGLSENRKTFDDGDDEETTPRAGKWKPITISDDGLELIELISLDCTADSGEWHADAEIKIDKKSFVIRDGAKTKQFWDGKIQTQQKPLRLKIRNIAGDETTIVL
jgi:adenine-specific DNA-methyltransferase